MFSLLFSVASLSSRSRRNVFIAFDGGNLIAAIMLVSIVPQIYFFILALLHPLATATPDDEYGDLFASDPLTWNSIEGDGGASLTTMPDNMDIFNHDSPAGNDVSLAMTPNNMDLSNINSPGIPNEVSLGTTPNNMDLFNEGSLLSSSGELRH